MQVLEVSRLSLVRLGSRSDHCEPFVGCLAWYARRVGDAAHESRQKLFQSYHFESRFDVDDKPANSNMMGEYMVSTAARWQ